VASRVICRMCSLCWRHCIAICLMLWFA